jgi:hypothetical protein
MPKHPKATEGYYKTSYGFSDPCAVCSKTAKVLSFSRKLDEKRSPEGVDISSFTIGSDLVCSFDCFKKTIDYVGPNPPPLSAMFFYLEAPERIAGIESAADNLGISFDNAAALIAKVIRRFPALREPTEWIETPFDAASRIMETASDDHF